MAASGANAASPMGTVSFSIDGASPVATVALVGGQASFTTSGLGAGPHTVTALYGGDAHFAASTSSPATVAVTTATTVTGSHPASLVVARGSAVLVKDAAVGGSIIVEAGGSLDLEGSTVAGALLASSPGSVRVCASRVQGQFVVSGARGFVLIGDSGDDGCGPNVVGRDLMVENDHHGVEIIDNHVAGAVAVTDHSGAGPFPEDSVPEVSGNLHG